MLTKLLTDTYLKIWVKGNPLSKVGHSLVIIHISLIYSYLQKNGVKEIGSNSVRTIIVLVGDTIDSKDRNGAPAVSRV